MNSFLLLQRTLCRSIESLEPRRAVTMALGGVRGAKKKAAGSSTNGRDSAGRRLVSMQFHNGGKTMFFLLSNSNIHRDV
jgi:hypothetical protein